MYRPARDRIVELWIPVVFVACVGHARGHTGRVFTLVRVLPPILPRSSGRDPRRGAGAPAAAPPQRTFRNFIGRTGVLSEAVRAHPTLGFGNENGFGALILIGASVLFIVS